MSAETGAVWRATRRLTAALLALWLLTTLAVVWFAHDLQAFRVFGFPAGYWAVAAAALLIYLAIVLAYAGLMDRIERPTKSERESPSTPADPA